MRELVSAVKLRKPLIAIVDPDTDRGGLSLEEIRDHLLQAEQSYDRWGFDASTPSGRALFDALTLRPSGQQSSGRQSAQESTESEIEWNRIGVFQEVSLRLIAERLLPANHRRRSVARSSENTRQKPVVSLCRSSSLSVNRRASQPSRSFASIRIHDSLTYTQKDITRGTYDLPTPRSGRRFHLYCSPQVFGSLELVQEVQAAHGLTVSVSCEAADLPDCERMLVYLHKGTWRIGEASELFAQEVAAALRSGVQLLLAHEMRGVGQEVRGGVDFADFFECEQGTTPLQLLRAGIYSQIAVPLKGGSHRKVSMALLAKALVDAPEDPPVLTGSSSAKLDALALNAASESQTMLVTLQDTDCPVDADKPKARGNPLHKWRRRLRPTMPILNYVQKRSDDPPGVLECGKI